MVEKSAYDEAATSGLYEKPTSLQGKYDNVRRFWEDEVICSFLGPYLERLVARWHKLRILDIGCGSGDGYEMLLSVTRRNVGFSQPDCKLLTPQLLDSYKGIDLNQNLIAQADAIYGGLGNVSFQVADFNDFASVVGKDPPYDLYFATYGTFSHNSAEQTINLLSRIARHGRDGSIIVCDWLGRYCYEWQTLWTDDLGQVKTIDYVISYIYSQEDRKADLSSFPLHLLCKQEVLAILEESSKAAGVEIELRELFDRSIFVGRHTDTKQYNPHCQPLRQTLNYLLEPNIRTDLATLLINYVPKEGFSELNGFYGRLAQGWNSLVTYAMELLDDLDRGGKGTPPPVAEAQPQVLRQVMQDMERIAKTAADLKVVGPRASIIEPQLAYRLRQLEMDMQEARGCGHGLVAILELHK